MTCAYQIDNVIVGRFLGAEMLGLYGRAFQVVTMPTKLLGVGLLNVLFPIMSRIKTEPERLSRAFLRSIRAVAIVGLPFSLLTAILAPEIVYILLGRQWEAVVVPFQLLSAAIVFRVGHKVCEALVRACGAVYQLAWTQWVYTVLVALGAYIGHFASLPGVAAGVAIAVALNFLIVFALVASLSYLPLSAIGIVLFRQLVILSGIAAVAIPAIFALRATGISEFFRVAILCSGVFLLYGSLWMFRTRAFGEEGEVFKSIFRQYLPLRTRTGDVA
jgi:PST family polysaccharide transporter